MLFSAFGLGVFHGTAFALRRWGKLLYVERSFHDLRSEI